MTVQEARLEQTPEGTVVASDGWFVLNVGDTAWLRDERGGGEWTSLEPEGGRFEQYGIGIHVLHPGERNGYYHSESMQEDFLVLSGECLLLVEEQERRLKAWDFVHCPPGTHHIFVGAGDGPCAILIVGARSDANRLHYPVSELAARHGASSAVDTDSARVAYADWPRDHVRMRLPWPRA
ncbi:MAG: cupin domain-containing protein [Actinomycetota bacterium]|nr:cupin domain-containing protein [Actinomycetota bacterium]